MTTTTGSDDKYKMICMFSIPRSDLRDGMAYLVMFNSKAHADSWVNGAGSQDASILNLPLRFLVSVVPEVTDPSKQVLVGVAHSSAPDLSDTTLLYGCVFPSAQDGRNCTMTCPWPSKASTS